MWQNKVDLFLQFWIERYVTQKNILSPRIVHLAAVVLQAVAHYQVVYMQQDVVGCNLVEHFLLQVDGWRLVLNNHARP